MTTIPLSIAIVCGDWGAEPDDVSRFEADVLRALLTVPSRHRFVLYPDSKAMRAIVAEVGAGSRVSFVRSVRKTRIHRRVWRRAKRLVRRRARPPFASVLMDALIAAGADCAFMPGGALVPLGMPFVATIRHLAHRALPWLPEFSATWRERDALYEEVTLRAAAVMVGSNSLALQLREAYGEPAGGAHVFPLPTPAFAIEASQRVRTPRPSDIPSRYLFHPGAFAPQQNHITAVRVLGAMSGMAAQPALVFAGPDRGTQAHVMREAEALGIASRVINLGVVSPDRLVTLYQHAEALVRPSLLAGDDTVPLEAMALGCPVIAADVPGAVEQLGDAGVLVDAMDPTAYVTAIRALRHDPLRRENLVERGMHHARGWTMPQYAAAVIALFDARVAPMRALWP